MASRPVLTEVTQSTPRFAELSADQKEKILQNLDAANTKRATCTSRKVFREYLNAKGQPTDFEHFQIAELDERLADFYMEMRGKDGQMYKKSTLIAYRHGLQRYIETVRDDINIIKDDAFKKSTKVFKSMTKELKRQGNAVVEHYPPINDADMEKLYAYLISSREDKQILQYKVFVDIMLHFGRRGRENLANLKINDFAVTTDATSSLYVYKVIDEQTKNHQNDSSKSADGRMYEIKESERCPVKSFVKYIKALNPKCFRLLQKVNTCPKDGMHFLGVPLGQNKLGTFMNNISKAAGLSKIYTNHSCRATTVHLLDAAHFPSRHIMTVTGHRSESSLKTYSGMTTDNTKKMMSETISKKTSGNSTMLPPQPETEPAHTETVDNINLDGALQTLTNSQSDQLMADLFNDKDNIDDILMSLSMPMGSRHNSTNLNTNTTITNNIPVSHVPHVPPPVLYNCPNVTINYNFMSK